MDPLKNALNKVTNSLQKTTITHGKNQNVKNASSVLDNVRQSGDSATNKLSLGTSTDSNLAMVWNNSMTEDKEKVIQEVLKNAKPMWGNHSFNTTPHIVAKKNTNEKKKANVKKKMSEYPFWCKLSELAYSSNEEILHYLLKETTSLKVFIDDLPVDAYPLLLRIIKKFSMCATSSQLRNILKVVLKPKFLEHMATHIIQARKKEPGEVVIMLENTVIVFERVLEVLSYDSILQLAPHIQGYIMCVMELKECPNVHVDYNILQQLQNLSEHLDKLLSFENKKLRPEDLMNRLRIIPPPNNFRRLSVYPTVEEILNKERPFLRPNLVNQKYDNVEHYLDVQYRLLREDFVRPLREGIASYINNGGTKPTTGESSIRLYSNVRFMENSEPDEEDEENLDEYGKPILKNIKGTKVKFICSSKSKLRNIDWKSSKRLMHNALVCFTKNNFQTLLFATVTFRDPKHLFQGFVYVEFCEAYKEDIFDAPYLMIENEVYFEPYYHVLKALQSLNSFTLPMTKYLVDMSCTTSLPQYSAMPHHMVYTLHGVEKCFTVSLMDDSTWPSHEQLGLDPSQLKALHAGLTQELAIIQGPPGTGKTFLGLKITQALLTEPQTSYRSGPILVVCLTNHALDQFLSGIANFTTKVVRIGGQSKNSELEMYNIKHKRRYSRMEMEIIVPIREQLDNQQKEILAFSAYLNTIQGAKPSAIVALSTLHYYGIITAEGTEYLNEGKLLSWLGLGGFTLQDINDLQYNILSTELTSNHLIYEINEVQKVVNLVRVDLIEYLAFLKGIQTKLNNLLSNPLYPTQDQVHCILSRCKGNLWHLSEDQRWQLYWHWVHKLTECLEKQMKKHQEHKFFLKQKLENVRREVDLKIMLESDVVGMTTTCAARLHHDLAEMEPEILIVEEAAEVLEAHIVACLTRSCKHLILIGDHKQLRPATSVYQLAQQFDFDVSLFERLVHGRGGCVTLEVQHRMSPCIATLITPTIYPQLLNHKSTELLKPVRGLPKRMFFVTHTQPEQQEKENSSFKNEFEAKYLLSLAEHLIRQGYTSKQITLICTYTAQMCYILREMQSRTLLKGMRVTVVDNFQGEENDIILLSLVRSNQFGNIGFLNTENRVCVALSRAREGLFILGNMDCLSKKSKLWRLIRTSLERHSAIGPALTIKCQIHPKNESHIYEPTEILEKSPLGGCQEICKSILQCGHSCNRFCHIENHNMVKCDFPCNRLCLHGHPCLKLCFELCICEESTHKILETCQHLVNSPCCADMEEEGDQIQCKESCKTLLKCGHMCLKRCHKNLDPEHKVFTCRAQCLRLKDGCNADHKCSKKCYEKCEPCNVSVKKLRKCGHILETACRTDVNTVICNESCFRYLECGHACPQKCSSLCGPCRTITTKTVPACGHEANVPCDEKPRRELCDKMCERQLPCGHICDLPCAVPCSPTQCKAPVACAQAICGHDVPLLCWEEQQGLQEPSDPCRCCEPCSVILECGHICSGTCGQCLQRRFHIPCEEDCLFTLVCGHKCPARCYETCVTCKQQCTYVCCHGQCPNKCGEPCVPCMEPCVRKCQHSKCSRLCGEICDVPPCNSPCPYLHPCEHACKGMCGDPCPPVCTICQPAYIERSTGGKTTPSPSRLAFLPSCGHTFDMSMLEGKINQDAVVVGLRKCPLCLVPMSNVPRYMGRIKKAYTDLQQVRNKQLSTHCVLDRQRKDLEDTVSRVLYEVPRNGTENPLILKTLEYLNETLKFKIGTNKNVLSQSSLNMKCVQFQVLKNLHSLWLFCNKFGCSTWKKENLSKITTCIIEVLKKENGKLGQQQVNDLWRELIRAKHIVQLEISSAKVGAAPWLIPAVKPSLKKLEDVVLDLSQPFSDKKCLLAKNLYSSLKNYIQAPDIVLEPLSDVLHVSKGFWFKCPNNHVTLLGREKVPKCSECKAPIKLPASLL